MASTHGQTASRLSERRESTARSQPSSFRPDIEGLRAVAVGLVLLYHAGVDHFAGGFVGVDVFFVISGFLITGLIVREIERTGRLSLLNFYARRAKRLLPASSLVLVFSAVVAYALLPVTQRTIFGGDVVAASLYVVNWVFANRSVDYLAEGVAVSPVQHFWSLAIEEQFYIVWPLLIVLGVLVARHRGVRLRPTLALGLVAVVLPSLIWSIHVSGATPTAFFVSTTRLWELGVGAAVALGTPWWVRVPRRVAGMASLLGILAILSSAVILNAAVIWPGWWATIPVVGTAAVIIGGHLGVDSLAYRFLSLRPAVWIGGLSYSLYLWHWPMLVGAAAMWGDLRTIHGLAVVAASFVPAWLSYRVVENPVRRSELLARSPRAALAIGALCMVVGVAAGLAVVGSAHTSTFRAVSTGEPTLFPGKTEVVGPEAWVAVDQVDHLSPLPEEATSDVPQTYDDGCQVGGEVAVVCEYGVESDVTVALVGDSMANMWHPAIDAIAVERGWRLVTILKSACPFADATIPYGGAEFRDCAEWNTDALKVIDELRPDLVLTNQNAYMGLSDPTDISSELSRDAMVEGLSSRWMHLGRMGVPVGVIIQGPHTPDEMYECVAKNPQDLTACVFEAKWSNREVQYRAVEAVPTAVAVDLTEHLCFENLCPSVIDNILVYRQGPHLTRTYVAHLEDEFGSALDAALLGVAPTLVSTSAG